MDLPDTWNNYKSLLAIIKDNNNENSFKDFLSQICSPLENLTNSTKLTQLFALAIELKNFEIVSLLLQHGVRGKPCEDLFKYTPMQCAVMSEYTSLILEMVQYGAPYDQVDNEGNTLLHLAVLNKNERWENAKTRDGRMWLKFQTEELIINTLRVLLDLGSDKKGESPLSLSDKYRKIPFDLGLDVNALNKKGESPLSLAVKYRMKKVTRFLIKRNSIPKIFDKSVSYFLIMDKIESIHKKETNSNLRKDGRPWEEQQKQEFMEWWFSQRLDINCESNLETPLHLCARYNMKSILEILLRYTNEINVVDALGRTLLHILIGSLESSVKGQMSEFEKVVELVELLIYKGIYVDEIDRRGNTPFHIAAKLKRPEIMQAILERFNNVNACNNLKETALHIIMKNYSYEYEDEYFEIAVKLIGKGADFNCQDRHGQTPLHILCQKNIAISDRIVKFLVLVGCNINIKDEKGVTPLYVAIQSKNYEMIELLMKNDVDVNCCEKTINSTPLHEATKINLRSLVESLLKAGAKTDIRDVLGQTPLHIAASDCGVSPTIMLLLLMFGTDIEVLDKDKKTPLLQAFDANVYEKVELLLKFGAKITIERSRLVPSRSESRAYNPKTLLIRHLVAQSLAGIFIRNCYMTVVQRAQRYFASFYEQCLQELGWVC